MKHTEWLAPIFVVIGILAVWLSLTYLPLSSLGIKLPTDKLWIYMPWVLVFAVGLYVLKEMLNRK